MGRDIRGFRSFNELTGIVSLAIEGFFLIYQPIYSDNKILNLIGLWLYLMHRRASPRIIQQQVYVGRASDLGVAALLLHLLQYLLAQLRVSVDGGEDLIVPLRRKTI